MKDKFTAEQIKKISDLARQARGHILKMTTLSASGHPGGSLSSIDMMMTLYHMMHVDPLNPNMSDRDRLIVSNGHISPAVYTTLGMMGFFDLQEAVAHFRQAGSIFEGHIERDVPGVEWGTGNLGQGLSAAIGMALACRMKGIQNQFYVLMGDGEQQKGQIAEARKFAVKYGMHNLTVLIDYNKLQIGGNIHHIMPQNIIDNYASDGWHVVETPGHDIEQIHHALIHAQQINAPVMILAHTVMGKGVPFMENKEKYHGSTLSEEQLAEALQILGIENDLEALKMKRASFNPRSVHRNLSFPITLQPNQPIVYEKSTDNRSAWGSAIADVAKANMDGGTPVAVFDCDLQGSVKTNDFEKITPQAFFQSGIMEHHTAVMAGAMSTAGIQTYWAEFGVFGIDETYNMHRLTDINHGNLKVVTTHVGIDVGEDGKTHQCIDYIGMMRNLYHFRTLVPADPNQTDRVIRWTAGKFGNFLIAMGRSKLDIVRKKTGEVFFDEAYQFHYGKADLLREGSHGALFVTGTPVGYAVKVVDMLAEEGLNLQLWNVASPLLPDDEALYQAAETGVIYTYEDHNVHSGLGSILANRIVELGLHVKLVKFGIEEYACSGTSEDVFRWCRLDVESIKQRIRETISR